MLLLLFISVELFIYFYGRKKEEIVCDRILVLGARLYKDALSPALLRRLNAALQYAYKYKDIPIIVSGGQVKGELCSEASKMKEYLLTKGIEASRIVVEDNSVDTYTNFLETKKILNGSDYKLLVVTCDFHMYRSISIGKKFGFMCFRWPAKSTTFASIKNFIREFFAILYYWIMKK